MCFTYVGKWRLSSEELVLDVLAEEERSSITFLVWDEVDDEHEDEVYNAFFDDGVHFDLFESHLASFLQRLHVRSVDGRLRCSALLQDFFSAQQRPGDITSLLSTVYVQRCHHHVVGTHCDKITKVVSWLFTAEFGTSKITQKHSPSIN